MKPNGNLRKRVALTLLLALTAIGAAGAGGPAAQAQSSAKPEIVGPQEQLYGSTYSEWVARHFQWWLSIPTSMNPMLDKTGEFCAQGQSGPVWFLIDTALSGSFTRACTIPADKAIMVAVTAVECSADEPPASGFHGSNEAEMRACAQGWMQKAFVREVAIDGVPLVNPATDYRFETPLYSVTYPKDNLFGLPEAGTTEFVGAGIYFMLRPLSPGQHTIYMNSGMEGVHDTQVTYNLTVSPVGMPRTGSASEPGEAIFAKLALALAVIAAGVALTASRARGKLVR